MDDHIAPRGAMRRRGARRHAVGGSREEAVGATCGVVGRSAEEWTTYAITRVTVTAVSAPVGAARDADVGVVVGRRRLLAAIAGQIAGRVAR